MARYQIIALILLACSVCIASAQMPDTERTQSDFEKFADELPYLALSTVLYDRPRHFFQIADPKIKETHDRLYAKVTDGTYPKEALLGLLTHRNAKVRTLATVALFDSEDASFLPALMALSDDTAATFDGYAELYVSRSSHMGMGPPAQKQTVGDIASKMVNFYLERAGYHYGIKHKSQPGFAEYWEAHKNRTYCASWFAVQLARAGQSTSPTRENRKQHIHELRQRIDKLPVEDRTWVLLSLQGNPGASELVSEQALVEACIAVGSDKLLLMLQKKIPSDDPDLKQRRMNNGVYRGMQMFVLQHAKEVLRPSDSDALLACERWERDYAKHGFSDPTITPWWAIAAARLNRDKAAEIMIPAVARFQGQFDTINRAILHVAIWQLLGKSQEQRIVDWFYTDSPEMGSFPNCRGWFIEAMRKEADGRQIIAPILKDKRLDSLDWQSLERLVRAVNGWIETPIVTDEQISKVSHPWGKGHYHWQKKKAQKMYPNESIELEKHLADWCNRLRMSVPQLVE